MGSITEGKLVRIFLGELDRSQRRPRYERIVREAKAVGLAGATVLRGIEGFGEAGHLHTVRLLRLSEDLPVVVEIVDSPERINDFLEDASDLLAGLTVTAERVEVWTGGGP